jgi:membrane associated rhomboid family serine protease
MGLYDRDYYRDERGPGVFLGTHTMVMKLVIANLLVFLANLFLGGPEDSITRTLLLEAENLREPWMWWRLVTYGFVHSPSIVGHIFMNMVVLWMFGRDVEGIYGSREFATFYFVALVLGSVAWGFRNLAMYPDSSEHFLLGASGAVTAVFMLYVCHFPHRTLNLFFLLPVPAWLVGALYILSDLVGFRRAMAGQMAGVAFDVHLVGAAFAFLYWRFSLRVSPIFLPNHWRWNLKWLRRRPKLRVHQPPTDEVDPELDEQADAILDKVSKVGLESLTANERRILEAYSRRMQQKHR